MSAHAAGPGPSRRQFLAALAAPALLPLASLGALRRSTTVPSERPCRIRTITAGVPLADASDLRPVELALACLARGRRLFEAEGYEVQTVRIATTPFLASLRPAEREAALVHLQALDRLVASHDAIASVGPLLLDDRADDELAPWCTQLVRTTGTISFSVGVASPARGTHPLAATASAQIMRALAAATPDGLANFRFAATANVPAGTPFFPAGYHQGPPTIALGLESAALVQRAFEETGDPKAAGRLLRQRLDADLAPIERTAVALAARERRAYLGIDPSPAPGLDRSIGAAIEAFTRVPFGGASTLDACAIVTGALRSLRVRTCGYAGLMLPVLEDPVLACRASEGRYDVRDLLLYSSVCGTGLDVVPIPGDTPVETLSRLVLDLAALSARWGKALSARLLLAPGKRAGDRVEFTDPRLTGCAVLGVA